MKYFILEGRYKVPKLTKEWKAMWFVLGMFLQYLAVFYAMFYYHRKFRNVPTVAKVARRWAAFGSWVMFIIVIGAYFIYGMSQP